MMTCAHDWEPVENPYPRPDPRYRRYVCVRCWVEIDLLEIPRC